MRSPPLLRPLSLLSTLTVGALLGCSGLLNKPPAQTEDTNPPAWEDTAARKAAKNAPHGKKHHAPAGPTEADLRVTVPTSSVYNAAEVQCTSGFRRRCVFASGSCTVLKVPTSDQAGCEVFFKGGERASFGPVVGGGSLSCTFPGGSASCRVGG